MKIIANAMVCLTQFLAPGPILQILVFVTVIIVRKTELSLAQYVRTLIVIFIQVGVGDPRGIRRHPQGLYCQSTHSIP